MCISDWEAANEHQNRQCTIESSELILHGAKGTSSIEPLMKYRSWLWQCFVDRAKLWRDRTSCQHARRRLATRRAQHVYKALRRPLSSFISPNFLNFQYVERTSFFKLVSHLQPVFSNGRSAQCSICSSDGDADLLRSLKSLLYPLSTTRPNHTEDPQELEEGHVSSCP